MQTTFFNDFDSWEIKGEGKTVYVKTTFSDDYERWTVSGDASGTIRTVFSNDFSKWDISVDFKGLPEDMKAAVVFIAVFTAFHLQ
jgi:hypothetical protein